MRNSPLPFGGRSADVQALSLAALARMAEGWILDGEIRNLSPATLSLRRLIVDKLLWFLRKSGADECGLTELRAFFSYLGRGHTDGAGRWGDERQRKAPRPSTTSTYHCHIRTLFRFALAEGAIDASPMERIAPPIERPDQIQPFTDDQIEGILRTARGSRYARRNEAIVLLLADSGMRASELCGLRMSDIDLTSQRATVVGKGNKRRSVPFGGKATKALWAHLREADPGPDDPAFASERGPSEPLTRWGLLQLIERLGKEAGVEGVRVSPHTFRHSFALNYLRNGGDSFSLMTILGHTSLTMTNRYVALADADIAAKHRLFSPMDRMLKGKGK